MERRWATVLVAPAVAELVGTAVVIAVGLSAVTLDFSSSSSLAAELGSLPVRRLVTGAVFATVVAAMVYSPLGRRSGGHFNPAVTVGFLYMRKLHWWGAVLYALCQATGAILGAATALWIWGQRARAVHLGASVPGHRGSLVAFAAELTLSFLLMFLILQCVDRPRLMRFTPVATGLLLTVIVVLEAPLSSTSLNPARSLGPAVVVSIFTALWVYLLAPPLGAVLAALAFSKLRGDVPCAKLVHRPGVPCSFWRCAYLPEDQERMTL